MKKFSRSEFFNILTDRSRESSHEVNSSDNIDNEVRLSSLGLDPYKGVWGQDQILHLIRRSLFGVTPADYDYFSNLNLEQCLDVLLTQSPLPAPPVNAYNTSTLIDPYVHYGKTWVLCPVVDEGIYNDKRLHSLKSWWVSLMLDQDRSLSEKMTLFWHNHIAAEFDFINDAVKSYTYATPLRSHSLGNFRKLIYDITISPGMLNYLSGNQSTAAAPNENYGRELQELFTVGKGKGSHYTQGDVVAAARVLTGWNNDKSGVNTIFMAETHDTDDKHFSTFYNNKIIKGRSGQAGKEELDEMLDMIFSVKEAARHTARSLYRWFVYSDINDTIEANIIEPLADILITSKYEIKPVLQALLGSEHFFDRINMACHIKNPADHIIGLCRQFGLEDFPTDISKQYHVWYTLSDLLSELAMQPGDPPNVAGWPAYYLSPSYYQLWINSDTLTARYTATDKLLSPDGLVYADTEMRLKFDVVGFTSKLSNPYDLNQLIIDSIALLSPVPFDNTQTAYMRDLLDSGHGSDLSWREVWREYSAKPNDPAIKSDVTDRLMKYYSYILQQGECQLM
jgi:uncharacterized protein (DUF1800 family)